MNHAIRRVIIEPGNPYDFSAEELEELRQEIAQDCSIAEVQLAVRPERGYGVTLHEVLYIWDIGTDIVGDITTVATPFAAAVAWARRRARKDRELHGAKARPRTVALLGPHGRILKQVVIDDPDIDSVVDTPEDHEPRHPPDASQ